MLIDPQGRIYVGHFGYDIAGRAEPQPASLLLVTPGGGISEVAGDLVFPNGIALSADGKTLVVAETFAHRLTAFDVQPDGSLSNRYTWASLPDHYPDGICMDARGGVWVGCTRKEQFLRVESGGYVSRRIETPGRWAIACALGGPNESKLFCATAETTQERMAAGDSRGFIEMADLGPPS